MADNNFKGGPGGRLKAAVANLNKPTTQDSLDIYNSTQELNNYYGNPKYGYKVSRKGAAIFGDGSKKFLSSNGLYAKDYNEGINIEDNLKRYSDDSYDYITDFPDWAKANNIRSTKDIKNLAAKARKNYASVMNNPYKGIIYDKITGNIDFAPPPAKFDTRIKDQGVITYKSIKGAPGADVELPYYDPIAVKPVSMLTPKERIEREKKYGKIPSSTPKPQPKPQPKPVQVIKRKVYEDIEPIQPRQAPVPQFEQPQMIAPVMRPVSIPQTTPMKEPMMEEEVVTERPVVRKPPRAVMPTRQGGWGNQPLLMKLFPKIYER